MGTRDNCSYQYNSVHHSKFEELGNWDLFGNCYLEIPVYTQSSSF
jgi:hypothetical protein